MVEVDAYLAHCHDKRQLGLSPLSHSQFVKHLVRELLGPENPLLDEESPKRKRNESEESDHSNLKLHMLRPLNSSPRYKTRLLAKRANQKKDRKISYFQLRCRNCDKKTTKYCEKCSSATMQVFALCEECYEEHAHAMLRE